MKENNIIGEYITSLLSKLNFDYISYKKKNIERVNHLNKVVHIIKLFKGTTIKLVENYSVEENDLFQISHITYKLDLYIGKNTDIFEDKNKVKSFDCISIMNDRLNKICVRDFQYSLLLFYIRQGIYNNITTEEYNKRSLLK